MNRDLIIRIVLAALVALGAIWFVTATEWADVEVNEPSKNEAARNSYYATQSTLRALGAKVVKRTNLDRMPPAGARLVLLSRHWDLFPDRPARLRQWVEAGGHLVVMGNAVGQKQLKWLPVQQVVARSSDDDDEDEDEKPQARPAANSDCRDVSVPDSLPSTFADHRTFRLCGNPPFQRHEAAAGHKASWELRSANGIEFVRVPVGQGSVTVIDPWNFLDNRFVLRGENALAMSAALQIQRGVEFWFVAEEARDPLVPWLWHEAWPAISLALIALMLALWRGAVRFGPVAAVAPNNRRSMTEQITGTAQFLRRTGPAALHAAQARALHEAAAHHLPHYVRLLPAARAQALAKATGLDAEALALAFNPTLRRNASQLAGDLDLLETARRLLARPAPARPPSPGSTSPGHQP
ncbi:MAG: DUF4350 domain-containing protein [Ramlibacter sp.]|nr:DUF4350 domain-containing protein [Ramlibacter sp.]